MKKYRIHSLPEGFSMMAHFAFKALDGYLYAIGTRLVLTDESDNIDEPRNEFNSFEALEDWLLRCVVDWVAEGKNDPMFEAIEQQIRHLI